MASSLLQTAREIALYAYDRAKDLRKDIRQDLRPGLRKDSRSPAEGMPVSQRTSQKIVCVPARDEADEIVALMLSQVLCDAGINAVYLRRAPTAELVQQTQAEHPDIICISALPPFVISHSRMLCRELKAASTAPVAVGLWRFAGDTKKLSSRLGPCSGSEIFTTLNEAVASLSGGLAGESASKFSGKRPESPELISSNL
jgi:hypothetical protein